MDRGEKLELIERLGRLRAEGALSEDEFAAEKAKLLASPERETVIAEPLPQIDDPSVDPAYQPEEIAGYDNGTRSKWIGTSLAILLFAGGGYWFAKVNNTGPTPDAQSYNSALSEGQVNSSSHAIARSELIGTWTPDQSCISDDGFDLYLDGTIGREDGSGTWSIDNDRLMMKESGQHFSNTIVSATNGQLILRYDDGSLGKFRRCSAAQVAEAKRTAEGDIAREEAERAGKDAKAAVEAASAAASNAGTSDFRGTKGRCRLTVDGRSYIQGSCWIKLESDGSFQAMSSDEKYFAQLDRSETEAQGFWNESPGSTHAQARLGVMTRRGPCWGNANAEICAWQ